MKYIAYGSNMVISQMARRCPDAKLIGTGYIENARLEFFLHATVECTKQKADRVPVAVWEISDADEQNLDFYEGFPHYYTKREWLAYLHTGESIEGMIYLMLTRRFLPPMDDYYRGIRDAYEELGLSSQIKTVLEPALTRALDRNQSKPFIGRE